MANPKNIDNTPQAVDDSATAGEGGTVLLDVMANDKGGNAKQLYSVNQTTHSDVALSGLSQLGGAVSIVGDKISYAASGATINALAQGQTVVDTFSYTIQMGNGALSWATVSVTLTGANDAPVVSGAVHGDATEDGPSVTLNALANASDPDAGTTLVVTGLPASLPAGVTYDSVHHSFTLDPSNAAYQALATGDTTTVTVNYQVSDGITSTSAQASWTVSGVTDTPFTEHIYSGGDFRLAVADLNGDGRPEVALADGGSNLLRILVNDGHGGLTPGATYFSNTAQDITVADVNNDGITDIVVGATYASGVDVFLGQGDGTFQHSALIPGDGVLTSVAVADVNGDGNADVISGDYYSHEVLIAYGHGDGTFDPPHALAAGFTPIYGLGTGDLGNGNQSLVVVSADAHLLQVFSNDGAGGFTLTQTLNAPAAPFYPELVDLGNGTVDLVVNSRDANVVTVFIGDGHGGFLPGVSYANHGGYDLAIGDVNGDGKLDIATTLGTSVSVLLGNGDGTFQNHVDIAIGIGATDIAIADMNGDGRNDIVVTGGGQIDVLLSNGWFV